VEYLLDVLLFSDMRNGLP